MHIYLLGGLGADKRVFDYLDLPQYHLHHVDWISPGNNESIGQYAQRIIGQIDQERPILLGVSFGGMIAIELGKLIDTEKIIVISSARTGDDIPLLYRVMNKLRLNEFVLMISIKTNLPLIYWFFGIETQAEKKLLRTVFSEIDFGFLKWAVRQISSWKNTEVSPNVVAIHGTHDRILPMSSADHMIEGGGHFMVVNKAKELSAMLRRILTSKQVLLRV